MALLETEAIVINSLKLGEADKLITFYTEKKGKVKAVARGARKLKNRFGSSLEPFSHVRLIVFEKKRTILGRIVQSDIIGSFQRLRENYLHILNASHLCRLISVFSPEEDPSPTGFRLLLCALEEVKRGGASSALINLYQFKFLSYSGYALRLDGCVKCGDLPPVIRFAPVMGGVVCQTCLKGMTGLNTVPVSRGTVALLKQTERLEPELLSRMKPSSEATTELRQILEVFIFHILGKHFPSI
ncbi:MAG TPA: DNA repair protein RecO [Nitrospiria bacterium]|nr:DNA repair protein RecO [Nitrospiria bacterium]